MIELAAGVFLGLTIALLIWLAFLPPPPDNKHRIIEPSKKNFLKQPEAFKANDYWIDSIRDKYKE